MGTQSIRKALLAVGLACFATGALAEGMASPAMLSGTCAGCHGSGGNSDGPAIPGIAGMTKNYFIAAMLAYKYGDDEAAIEKVVADNPSVLDADVFEALPRGGGTIMARIARGFEDAEIFAMADVFAQAQFVRHPQAADAKLVDRGAGLHEKNCEKCHEDGGRTSIDDVGILAGQWMPYLSDTLSDFKDGVRKMPKKMAAKMKDLDQAELEALVHYYGSQKQ
jgi:sulfide dehydrogenase cytochrome subunit